MDEPEHHTYRGLVRVDKDATGCKSHVQCDALILDEDSESRTIPVMEVGSALTALVNSPATIGRWFCPASHSSARSTPSSCPVDMTGSFPGSSRVKPDRGPESPCFQGV